MPNLHTWPMSENLDLVREIYADWERGDFSETEWANPEIEFVTVGGPEPGRVKGLTAMEERFRDFLTAWEDIRPDVEEYRELDAERLLVLVHRVARGKTSRLEIVGASGAELLHIRGGKVTKFTWYWDREEALADLGLAPEGDAPDSP
jgi:ketosteroid isomerase-like protein